MRPLASSLTRWSTAQAVLRRFSVRPWYSLGVIRIVWAIYACSRFRTIRFLKLLIKTITKSDRLVFICIMLFFSLSQSMYVVSLEWHHFAVSIFKWFYFPCAVWFSDENHSVLLKLASYKYKFRIIFNFKTKLILDCTSLVWNLIPLNTI